MRGKFIYQSSESATIDNKCFSTLHLPVMLKKLIRKPFRMFQKNNYCTLPKFQTLTVRSPYKYVVHVELNRPDKLNAMNRSMWLEIGECFKNLSENPDCRVVVLSGAGDKLFCAGIDFNDFMGLGAELQKYEDIARKSNVLWKVIRTYQDSITSIESCVKPVIAAVHGACIGGGLNLVCAADFRYSTSDAWFQNKEVDLGMAADVGTLQRMPKIIGSLGLVYELAYTCKKFPASEAKESGFVNQIFDTKDSLIKGALETAKIIAGKSPVAVQGTKRSIIYSRDHTVQEGLDQIALYNMSMLQSEDFLKAVTAQISKAEPPVFSKL